MTPVVVVYCEGRSDQPHERFIAAAYERVHDNMAASGAAWQRLKAHNGIQLRQGEKPAYARDALVDGQHLRHEIRCARCLQRWRAADADGSVSVRLYGVLDKLHAAGLTAVSLRALVAMLDTP